MKIKIGSTRIVLVFENTVIKVPIFLSWRRFIAGAASNYNEALTWKATTVDIINGTDDQDYLCQVYKNIGGIILIAERVQRLSDEEFDNLPEYTLSKLRTLLPNKSELNSQNVGKIEEDGLLRYKVLDYGVNILIKSIKDRRSIAFLKKIRHILHFEC